jgi:hypothetical protein
MQEDGAIGLFGHWIVDGPELWAVQRQAKGLCLPADENFWVRFTIEKLDAGCYY